MPKNEPTLGMPPVLYSDHALVICDENVWGEMFSQASERTKEHDEDGYSIQSIRHPEHGLITAIIYRGNVFVVRGRHVDRRNLRSRGTWLDEFHPR